MMLIVRTYDREQAIRRYLEDSGSADEPQFFTEIALGGISYRVDTAYHGSFVCETFCGKDGGYYTKVWELLD